MQKIINKKNNWFNSDDLLKIKLKLFNNKKAFIKVIILYYVNIFKKINKFIYDDLFRIIFLLFKFNNILVVL